MALSRIVTPSNGAECWKGLLANPKVQWKAGRSAYELANSWEAVATTESGLPREVGSVFEASLIFRGAELLVAVPEHQVALDNDRSPSQNDLWLLVATPNGCASVAVEAKAGEAFGETVEHWFKRESRGKTKRFNFLSEELGLTGKPPDDIRYQLLHRTASAILEARRFRLKLALMLVQSFGRSEGEWPDYKKFGELMGIAVSRNCISGPRRVGEIDLFMGWVDSELAR